MQEHDDVRNYLLEVRKILNEVYISVEALGRTLSDNDVFLQDAWLREKELVRQDLSARSWQEERHNAPIPRRRG